MDHPNTHPRVDSEPETITKEFKSYRNKGQIFFTVVIVVLLLVVFGLIAFVITSNNAKLRNLNDIDSFEDCIAAGFPALESYPRRCITSDGRSFTEIIEDEEEEEEEPISYVVSEDSVNIYFSKDPESFDDPEFTGFVRRTYEDNQNLVIFVINELIKGPSLSEQNEDDLFSELELSGESNCDGNNYEYSISSSQLELKFCKEIISSGVLMDARIKSFVEKTLLELNLFDEVVLLDRNGEPLFSGM